MSKYIKKKTEDLMKIGSDETLFADSEKTYYPSPWWKFWDSDRKIKSERKIVFGEYHTVSHPDYGSIDERRWQGYEREFDNKGNLVSVSHIEEDGISHAKRSLDIKSGIISVIPEVRLNDNPFITRLHPNGTFDRTFYLKGGRRMVSTGDVDDEGLLEEKSLRVFDANGKQTSGEWFGKKVVAKGKLKEILQKGLSAGALEEKARKLDGLKGTDRIKASKELYSDARKEMHKEQKESIVPANRNRMSHRSTRGPRMSSMLGSVSMRKPVPRMRSTGSAMRSTRGPWRGSSMGV